MASSRREHPRRSNARLSLRSVLVGLVALPFLTSVLFSSLWVQNRIEVAEKAESDANEVGVLTDSAELRFSVEIDMLIGYGPISSIDPRGATQDGVGRSRLRARQAFLAESLLERSDVLEQLAGENASEDLRDIFDRLRALWNRPPDDSQLWIHEEIAKRLATLDGAVNSGAAGRSVEVAYTLREFGRLQEMMKSEAFLIIEALDPANRTPATAARLDLIASQERATLEDLATVIDPTAMATLRSQADQPEIQRIRDAIATDSGLENRGVTMDSLDLMALVDVATEWFYSVPKAREAFATNATRAANQAVADAESIQRLATVLSIFLMATIALVTPFVIRSVTAPLRSLAERASTAAAGNVPGPEPARTFTREIEETRASFRRLNDFVQTVGAQIGALGFGNTDDVILSHTLPGAIGEDIQRSVSRLTETTARLRASEALSNAIVDSAVDGIWTLSETLTVIGVNSAAASMSGRSASEITGRQLSDLHPELAWYLHLGALPRAEQEFQLRRADDAVIDALVSVRSVVDSDGTSLLVVFVRDVSERKHLEDRLSHQAHHDHLTGLPNRMALLDEIDAALDDLDDDEGLGVLFLDLDRFKLVNDALGHECGDRLLVAVGDRIRDTLRDGDFVARLGGDEFVIVLRGLSSDTEAEAAANRVRTILVQPIDIGGVDEMRVEASVGVAWVADRELAARDLLHRADLAMYRAKQGGRARVEIYDIAMQDWASQRNRIEQGLRSALIAGELQAFVQPILDLTTGEVVGGELLTRWFHQGEWIAPDVFIPLAEESALIGELGKWVLHRACAVLAEWEALGWDHYLAVNISGLHLMTGDVDADIRSALAAHPIDPTRLKIEITESFLLGDPDTAINRLEILRSMGIGVLVDDFGTGYSSLTYLRRLPIDGIKLDRSFVSDIEDRSSDTTIVDLVAKLADSLRLDSVAEGIETEDQLEAIRRAGYTAGQGWLWAKAMPTADFVEWTRAHSTAPAHDR